MAPASPATASRRSYQRPTALSPSVLAFGNEDFRRQVSDTEFEAAVNEIREMLKADDLSEHVRDGLRAERNRLDAERYPGPPSHRFSG